MDNLDIERLTPDELREYMSTHDERNYLVYDVRQPAEYRQGHIPGSVLFPLMELEARLFTLPPDKDLVFCCQWGGRSEAAAFLAVEGEITTKRVFHLMGGIQAWEGKLLPDLPRVQAFDRTAGLPELLRTAMELEKGAYRFYRALFRRHEGEAFAEILGRLAGEETAHARLIHRILAKTEKRPGPFETVFDALAGEIMEGGEPLNKALDRVAAVEGNVCVSSLELALHMEYMAYDLYRTMAARTEIPESRPAFLSIAQAEKGHMRMIAEAVAQCPGL